ncbi:unnamed protein product, partial [Polarella glacialis]
MYIGGDRCALRTPLLRVALAALDETVALKHGGMARGFSTLALTFRVPILLAHARARRRLAQMPLAELGLSDGKVPPSRSATGRWGIGRHLGAAVAALAIAEELSQLPELAPCCGMSSNSPSFQQLCFVPAAAAPQPGALLKQLEAEAVHIFGFALQLPLLTFGQPQVLDAEGVAAALRQVAVNSPWADTRAFVSKHFRELLAYLDPVLIAWAPWLPAATVSLLRTFVSWLGPLSGSRLRLLLPVLLRHGNQLPSEQQKEMGSIAEAAIAASASLAGGEALRSLSRHRDETLRSLLAMVERQWARAPENSASSEASPALSALMAVLRGLRATQSEEGAHWLQLQLKAMLPRLHTTARQLLCEAAGLVDEADASSRPAKRLKSMHSKSSLLLGPAAALQQLAPPMASLAWGPPPAPDLGAVVNCLGVEAVEAPAAPCDAVQAASVMSQALRLVSQPQPISQLRRDAPLARALACGLADLGPAAAAGAGLSLTSASMGRCCQEEDPHADAVELAVYGLIQPAGKKQQQLPNADELLCCGALLGATHLQVHPSARVRGLALAALRQLAANKTLLLTARKLLGQILDSRHLCLQDLDDFIDSPVQAAPLPSQNAAVRKSTEEVRWQLVREGLDFSTWVRTLSVELLALGSAVWDGPALGVLAACVPLAQHVAWFAERLLVLALLKAASLPRSGGNLAKALTEFFKREDSDSAQAQCLLRALHLMRMHHTGQRQRAVPHFPEDSKDAFWSSLDLCAAAACASRVGRPRDGLLYLELHLARMHPDLAPDQALLPGGPTSELRQLGVEGLFRAPGPEVRLLHDLARQLPEDELLYGVTQWCHASSRLARAELGQDHLATLHLRCELLEAALHARGGTLGSEREESQEAARLGLDDALARLGLYPLLVGGDAPAESAQSSSAAWERRMEGLWRLSQWDQIPVPGERQQGFHAGIHAALSGLSNAAAEVAAAERPLPSLVANVAKGLQGQQSELLRQGAVQLQMLGSIFSLTDALSEDARRQQNMSAAVAALAERWRVLPERKELGSAQHFLQIEPLYALRATLLAIAAPPHQELRFLTALAGLAREASHPHRALGLIERAASQAVRRSAISVVSAGSSKDLLRLRWEQARCLWDLGQPQEALSIAKLLADTLRSCTPGATSATSAVVASGVDDRSFAAQVVSGTGLWLSISRLESTDVILNNYLEPACLIDPSGAQPRRQLADYLDSRLSEERARQGSLEHARTQEARRQTEANLAAVMQEMATLRLNTHANPLQLQKQLQSLAEQKRKLELQNKDDSDASARDKEFVKGLALNCVKQLARCLVEGSQENLTQVACRFLSLWFEYSQEYPEVTTTVREVTPKLKLGALMPFIYQLASRLDGGSTSGASQGSAAAFQQTLDELLVKLASRGTDALWPLVQLRNGDQVHESMRHSQSFVADTAKTKAAARVLEQLRKKPEVRSVLATVEVLNRFYLAIAFHPIQKEKRGSIEVPFTSVAHYREVREALRVAPVPVPTAPPGVEGGPPQACIHAFEGVFRIAPQGISCPKDIKVRDSTGREHRQLVKGQDDLRQDAVMQQLFRLLNDVFEDNPKSRQTNLRLRTYQAVPLSPCAGIVEWVQNTDTIGDLLVGHNEKHYTDGAHTKYRPKDWNHNDCRKHMNDVKGSSRALQEKALAHVYEKIKPVMHLLFLERFPSPADWHSARQNYARSVAVSSMVGYVVGLGDRHTNNILFDKLTGEIVHIDFGYTFEAGTALSIPERVPFRLTRDMVAGLGCLGTCGLFRRCCETAMEVLRSSAPLVLGVTDVFVHDPLYSWALNGNKAKQQSDPQQSAQSHRTSPAADGNEMAKRALMTVKGKLLGESGSAALGVPAHVGQVIHEAMDISNLCRMFGGWSQWTAPQKGRHLKEELRAEARWSHKRHAIVRDGQQGFEKTKMRLACVRPSDSETDSLGVSGDSDGDVAGPRAGHSKAQDEQDVDFLEYAQSLGAELQEPDMAWVAREAFDSPLPSSWSEHVDGGGRVYFFNQ